MFNRVIIEKNDRRKVIDSSRRMLSAKLHNTRTTSRDQIMEALTDLQHRQTIAPHDFIITLNT